MRSYLACYLVVALIAGCSDNSQPAARKYTAPSRRPATSVTFSPANPDPGVGLAISRQLKQLGYVDIPLSIDPKGYVSVGVEVEGCSLTLLLDTGSPVTFLDRTRCHLALEDWMPIASGTYDRWTGERSTTYRRVIKTLALKGLITENVTVYSKNMAPLNAQNLSAGGIAVDGLLGTELLEKFNPVIDLGNKTLYLKPISLAP